MAVGPLVRLAATSLVLVLAHATPAMAADAGSADAAADAAGLDAAVDAAGLVDARAPDGAAATGGAAGGMGGAAGTGRAGAGGASAGSSSDGSVTFSVAGAGPTLRNAHDVGTCGCRVGTHDGSAAPSLLALSLWVAARRRRRGSKPATAANERSTHR